jgi:hypothetical protein
LERLEPYSCHGISPSSQTELLPIASKLSNRRRRAAQWASACRIEELPTQSDLDLRHLGEVGQQLRDAPGPFVETRTHVRLGQSLL